MIRFFSEDVDFQLEGKLKKRNWIEKVLENSGLKSGDINYIFCSDSYLLEINKQFLDHDYFTDIITFPVDDDRKGRISSDMYLSIERIEDNAKNLGLSFDNELLRVMIHGILHLLGYEDKSIPGEQDMRNQEDRWMAFFHVMEG